MLPQLCTKVQVVYHVQSIHGGNCVYIQLSEFFHYILGRGGAEQCHLLVGIAVFFQNACMVDVDVGGFKLQKNLTGPLNHFLRQSCKAGNLYAEALIRSAPDYLSEEDYVLPYLFYGYAVVLYAWKLSFKLGELMIVGPRETPRG